MQLANVDKYLAVGLAVYIIAIASWRMFPLKYQHISLLSLSDIARRDLSVVGDYEQKFTNSLTRLLENVYQKLYVFCDMSFEETAELLHNWEAVNTCDPQCKIHNLIDKVRYDLEKRWDEYKRVRVGSDKEPFNVCVTEADLPGVSSVLRCNDHVDTESLYALYYDVLKRRSSDGT